MKVSYLFLLLICIFIVAEGRRNPSKGKRRKNQPKQKSRTPKGIILNNQRSKIRKLEDVIGPAYTFRTFERCDHGTPDRIGDCTMYQRDNQSCCYFSYGNAEGCIMLPIRYLGSTVYGGMTVVCSSKYFTISIISLLYILLIHL